MSEKNDKNMPLKSHLDPELQDVCVESNLNISSNIKIDFGVSMSENTFKGIGLPYADKIK